jgi:hypothetical protein
VGEVLRGLHAGYLSRRPQSPSLAYSLRPCGLTLI